MPELPEVETVCNSLRGLIQDQPKIKRLHFIRRNLRFPVPFGIEDKLLDQPILAIHRRAKYILVETPKWTLLNHLGMTGSWRVLDNEDEKAHDHCLLQLGNNKTLIFNDPRRFGFFDICEKGQENNCKWLVHLGPEPFDQKQFTANYLFNDVKNKSAPIKNLIMNQKIVVGVGNIYASEALFKAKIRPQRLGKKLSRQDCARLIKAITQVFHAAIRSGGTTIRDFQQVNGDSGYFQQKLNVYDRTGEPCRKCKKPIRHLVQAGRSTYWCPNCQK